MDLLLHLSVWVFWVIKDGSTHYNSSFFDMRICINISDILFDLHLVAIPMFERHIVENIFNLIACFLDALSGVTTIWCAKFMFVSTDGKNTMIGCHRGIVIRLEQATEFSVLCIWCVSHHIDIVIKNVATLPQHGQWIEVVYKWCVHLCCQKKFIMDMNGEMCPKKTNWHVHFDSTLKFYISRWHQIVKHTNAHVHFESLSTKWWMIMLIVASTISKINKIVF